MISALIDILNAPSDRAKAFTCSSCPEGVKKIRRCREDRIDFTDKDGAIWPMRVADGGGLYGFCPGKAFWDHNVVSIYQALVVCHTTGAHWLDGGISDQPSWWVDLVAEFIPKIDDQRFYSRARAILGDGSSKGANNGNLQRHAGSKNSLGRK